MWWPDYSAIQWPCDSGFHIPSTAERTAVLNIVWTSWDDYFTYLHIPKCWYRDRKTANIITTYWFSRYWTYDMSAKDKADCWGIEANNVAQMYADDKPANWYPIRAFKDNPITPDSDWTETMSGKVWYNSTLWLISIKNWSDWITMQDKNVWATVVYNDGDTVNDSNAGSFFQFWNYYWFPYSGSLNTYTSLQDTTGYGWQNPYSDSHFVKINSNNWFSNTNNDIWWGVTWIVHKEFSAVYKGVTQIWPWDLVAHSDMQWPSPDWYHIPSYAEWNQIVYTLVSSLWLARSDTTPKTYLKMPASWWRYSINWGLLSEGTVFAYWSSTANIDPYSFLVDAWQNTFRVLYHQRTLWLNIRCIKDTAIAPDNNRTVLYNWSSVAVWAWVFWNSSLWLISISWDWINRYTIQDKNLWATVVYNNWDTLTDANCGYFYQWWNNYWFPHSWTINTSSTKVDASAYWPWNYYSSNTFITGSLTEWRESSDNENLWGWVTQWHWFS